MTISIQKEKLPPIWQYHTTIAIQQTVTDCRSGLGGGRAGVGDGRAGVGDGRQTAADWCLERTVTHGIPLVTVRLPFPNHVEVETKCLHFYLVLFFPPRTMR